MLSLKDTRGRSAALARLNMSTVLLVFLLHFVPAFTSLRPEPMNIGAVLDHDTDAYFKQVIEHYNTEYNIMVYSQTVQMNSNPIKTAQMVCNHLITAPVFAVVISHRESSLSGELSAAAVSYTCGFYNVPVIGISSRHSSLSDKNLHKTFLRTVPPYSHQADVWIELLKFLEYKCVVFIHSSDNDGRATLGRFQNFAESSHPKIILERVIEYEPGISEKTITEQFEEVKEQHCRVFVLYANTEDAKDIFEEVTRLNMTTPGYVWIVSEQALEAENVPNGIIGITLVNGTNERLHIKDSVTILFKALLQLKSEGDMTYPPRNCNVVGQTWESGTKLVNLLKHQTIERGETGHVRFDDKGDRLNSDYEIINIVDRTPIPVGEYVFKKYSKVMTLSMDLNEVVWPGNALEKPLGFIIPKHLRVVTIKEKPFVWVRAVADESECEESEIPCPWTNSNGTSSQYCCRGYCMDLLRRLAQDLNFTYSVYQVQDGLYGTYDFVNGSTEKRWTGMVGDLVRGTADMIMAPLTITPERSVDIDFTKPFKYQGITILAKKQDKSSTLASFLQPFQETLWILVMVSVHVVALALYLLDRFSPFGRYKLPNSDATEEDALNLSSAIWFAWGVLLNSGIAEGTPRSFSGRVLGMVWAGFAMIVVASYTANLAAFLVLEKPESSLSGINDARLRNPSEKFTYATVKGSAVDMYFRRQVELSNMYRTMEGRNYASVEEAIEAVKEEKLDAFIWDSSRLEFEAAQDCELVTAGEQFGRSGYGIGLQRNSFWVDKVTLKLLELHESGFMERLDYRWIIGEGQKCESKNERTPATLGLKNMAGVFILVGAGIVGGIGLIVIEIIYKKNHTRKQRRLELARHAADKWRGTVEDHACADNRISNLHTNDSSIKGPHSTSIASTLNAPWSIDSNQGSDDSDTMENIESENASGRNGQQHSHKDRACSEPDPADDVFTLSSFPLTPPSSCELNLPKGDDSDVSSRDRPPGGGNKDDVWLAREETAPSSPELSNSVEEIVQKISTA